MTAEVLGFLNAHPGRIALFEAVEKVILSLGPSEMAVAKTQISWGSPKKFGFLSLPIRMGKETPEGSLVLSFGLDHREEHPKIAVASNPYPNRWTYHVVLAAPGDVDDTVRGFLREAYIFSMVKTRRK